MAKRDDVFPSKYLKAADLGGKPLTVTIEDAPLEELKSAEGKSQTKPDDNGNEGQDGRLHPHPAARAARIAKDKAETAEEKRRS